MVAVDTAPSYQLVTDLDKLRSLADHVINSGLPFGFDIETGYDGESREGAAVHPEENFVVGISFTNSINWAVYVPLRHDTGVNLPNRDCAEIFWRLLQTGLGVAHNAAFELRCMSRWFVEHISANRTVREFKGYFPVRSDTLIERYIEGTLESKNPEGKGIASSAYALKPATWAAFGHKMTDIHELFGESLTDKQKKSIRFNVLDQHDPKVYSYAGEDSVWCLAHHLDVYDRVKNHFLYTVEMRILYILCEMEDYGVKYDWNFMREGAARGRSFREKLQMEVQAELQRMISDKTGENDVLKINLGSPAQLSKVLFERLGMRTTVLTKGDKNGNRKMSTGKIALKGLSMQYPAVKKILNWKNLSRLIGTYLEKYEGAYDFAGDGLTHPSHMQCAVVSGRFAVASPPYQQSPKKYHYELADGSCFDFNFRDAIVAPPGHYILGFDYSQIELRVIAGEAGETALLEAFANGEDVHSKTASLMLGKPLDAVTPDDRAIGKTMNFALMYQMGVDGLADRLGITLEEAEELFNQYFAVYSNIHQWIQRTVNTAKNTGFTMSRFGRRHTIWEFRSDKRYIYSKGERLAGNAPIQGGAADYMKVAMVKADKALRDAGLKDAVHLVMNIHDALEFYVRDDIPPKRVIDVLQAAVIFEVPNSGWPAMEAEWHLGRRWGSVKDLEVLPDGIRVKGGDDASTRVVEQDGEDEDEDGAPMLDAQDVEIMRARLRPPTASELGDQFSQLADDYEELGRMEAEISARGPSTVFIHVTDMPSPDTYGRLLALVAAVPGSNTLILKTPGGDVTLTTNTGISPRSQAQVALILGGAEVVYAPESVDVAALAEGLL